jgi:hypothetical protein
VNYTIDLIQGKENQALVSNIINLSVMYPLLEFAPVTTVLIVLRVKSCPKDIETEENYIVNKLSFRGTENSDNFSTLVNMFRSHRSSCNSNKSDGIIESLLRTTGQSPIIL